MRRAALVVALATLASTACGVTEPREDDGRDGISRETFIEVYVELRRARMVASDSAAFDTLKRDLLERRDITPEGLTDFVRRHAEDPEYLAALWDSIGARFTEVADSTAAADSSGEDGPRDEGAARRPGPDRPVPDPPEVPPARRPGPRGH